MKVNKKAIIFVLFFFCIAIAMPIVLGNNKENENIKNINEYSGLCGIGAGLEKMECIC